MLDGLDAYLSRHPGERSIVERFAAFAASGEDVYTRQRLDGHFTASCWLLSPDRSAVLLTHHRKLNRWLQLGGHADGERDLSKVALTEASEESGIPGLSVVAEIFDLDAHRIPARGIEPEHTHWDVRFVVLAPSWDKVLSHESLALEWRELRLLLDDPDASLRRMARKWLLRERVAA